MPKKLLSTDPIKVIQYQAKMQKGHLDESDLRTYGKKIRTSGEKFKIFFENLAVRLIKGKEESKKYKTDFLVNKSIQVIEGINKKKLQKKIPNIKNNDLPKYLAFLQKGDILVNNSPHWEKIKQMHSLNEFVNETKETLDHHWLKNFSNSDDLGEYLEGLDPFLVFENRGDRENSNPTFLIYNLNQLYQSYLIPDFTPLLQSVLGANGKLKEMNEEQVKEFEDGLSLYHHLNKMNVKEPLEKTKSLLFYFKIIGKRKGIAARDQFKNILLSKPLLIELLSTVPYVANNQLYEIQELISELSTNLPEDLPFSESMEEIIEALNDQKHSLDASIIEKKFGQKLGGKYLILNQVEENKGVILKLHDIERNFRLCGQSERFIQLLDKSFGGAIENPKQFAEKFKNFENEHSSALYLIENLSKHSKEYLQYGISAKEVRAFQKRVIEAIDQKLWLIAKIQGKEGIDQDLESKVVEFNLELLRKAQQLWQEQFGDVFVEQFNIALGTQVIEGKQFYKPSEQQVINHAEISAAFVRFNAALLEAEFGKEFMNHAMHYLLSTEGNALQKSFDDFETIEWPKLLAKLRDVKNKIVNDDFPSEKFQIELNHFLTQSLYSVTEGNWLILNDASLNLFVEKIQLLQTNEMLMKLEERNGKAFRSSLESYLKENESDALLGKISFYDTMVFKTGSIENQVRFFLLPYLINDLQPFVKINKEKISIFDKEMISNILLKEPLTEQNLQVRFDHLMRLKKTYFKKLTNKNEVTVIKSLVKHLNNPYIVNFELDLSKVFLDSKQKKIFNKSEELTEESLKKLLKFYKEVNPKGIYSPDLFSRGVHEFLKVSGKGKKTEEKLSHFAEKSTKFLNSKVKEEFHSICFNLYLEDCAKEVCRKQLRAYDPSIAGLVKGLQLRFKNQQEGIKSEASAAYLKELIEFSVTLSLHNPEKAYITLDAISKESKHLLLNMKTINEKAKNKANQLIIAEDIKLKINDAVQDGSIEKLKGITRVLQENPFEIINEFVPRLMENLLDKKDRKQVKKLRKGLVQIGAFFYQSAFAKVGVNLITRGLQTLIDLKNLDLHESMNANKIKELIIEPVNHFNAFDIGQLRNLEYQNRSEYKDFLEQNNLSIFEILTDKILKNLADSHRTIHGEELNKKGGAEVIFKEFLPALVQHRSKIEKAIQGLEFLLPLVRKVGAGWLVSKILKMLLASQLEKIEQLDAPTKKLILGSIETIITTLLLAAPELLKRHSFKTYFDFLEGLNAQMQSPEQMDKNELFIDLLTVIQQGTKELAEYGSLLEQVVDDTMTALKI